MTFPMSLQALRAMQELHANVAAEHRAMHEFEAAWHATITPHQDVRAELAAWPHGVFPLRMTRYLGAHPGCMPRVQWLLGGEPGSRLRQFRRRPSDLTLSARCSVAYVALVSTGLLEEVSVLACLDVHGRKPSTIIDDSRCWLLAEECGDGGNCGDAETKHLAH